MRGSELGGDGGDAWHGSVIVVRQRRTGMAVMHGRRISGQGEAPIGDGGKWVAVGTNRCTKTKAMTHRSTLVADLDANLDHVDGLDDASGNHS